MSNQTFTVGNDTYTVSQLRTMSKSSDPTIKASVVTVASQWAMQAIANGDLTLFADLGAIAKVAQASERAHLTQAEIDANKAQDRVKLLEAIESFNTLMRAIQKNALTIVDNFDASIYNGFVSNNTTSTINWFERVGTKIAELTENLTRPVEPTKQIMALRETKKDETTE